MVMDLFVHRLCYEIFDDHQQIHGQRDIFLFTFGMSKGKTNKLTSFSCVRTEKKNVYKTFFFICLFLQPGSITYVHSTFTKVTVRKS